ncbi:MAG: hypothetical protein QOC96_3250 [Acidobacteriota bacterium]|nr:hypothetical protein [Acidobacteriota bacterium]
MKRLAAFAFLLISVALPCSAQQKEKRRPGILALWGPVHTIRLERATFVMENGEPVESERVLVEIITYSEDGTKLEQVRYRPDGSVMLTATELYDLDGRVLESTHFNSQGDVVYKIVSNYDSQKKLIGEIFYDPDGSIRRRRTIVRRGNPQVFESTVYDQDGAVISKSRANWSAPTVTFESFFFNAGQAIKQETVNIPTPNGGQIRETRTEGKPPEREESIRITKDVSERIQYNPDGTIRSRDRFTFEFDSHNNLIKRIWSVAVGDSTDFVPVEVMYWTIEYYQ